MSKTLLFLTLGLALMCLTANASVIEIPLPELLGTYPLDQSNAERTSAFELPQIPVEIYGAWIRISGIAEVGSVACEWGGPHPWSMDIEAIMRDTAFAHFWFAFEPMPETAGPFSWTEQFTPSPPTATWEFLMDGQAEVTLYGAPMILVGLCGPVTPGPTAVVTEAVLIIDGEFPVPAKQSTWGRIKILFNKP